ncbi:MAG TPA: hypothetical protein VKB84_00135 [Candidatus Binataceae bacterium]|jgi:hypothetical protein|nr:hypothetical protein [Candidatus Binataceae bacterium]
MARRLKLVKGAGPRTTLVYGMRMFGIEEVKAVEDATARLADGGASRITMHVIEGTRAQIRTQLIRSVDAFFDLLDEQ